MFAFIGIAAISFGELRGMDAAVLAADYAGFQTPLSISVTQNPDGSASAKASVSSNTGETGQYVIVTVDPDGMFTTQPFNLARRTDCWKGDEATDAFSHLCVEAWRQGYPLFPKCVTLLDYDRGSEWPFMFGRLPRGPGGSFLIYHSDTGDVDIEPGR